MFPLNTATRVGLNILIVFGVIVALRLGQTVFLPMIIALLLAAVLGPAALWLHQQLKMNWTLACTSAVIGLIILFAMITLVFALSLPRLLHFFPNINDETAIKEHYKTKFLPIVTRLSPLPLDEELFPSDPKSVDDIRVYQNLIEFGRRYGPELLLTISWVGMNWFWQWILILFILFFLLLEGGMLTRRLVEIFGPSAEVQTSARRVLLDMARQVNNYIVWRTLINVWLGIVVGAVFQVAGLNQPWTWALLLGILNYIPYLGPLVAAVPPFVDALISVSPVAAIVVLIVYTSIIVIEGYLIVPLVMGRSMELNATTVMLACLFWDLVWGTMGLFLAMPLMAAMRAICFHVPGWRPWANLMSTGDEEPQPVILKKEAAAAETGVATTLPLPTAGGDGSGRGAAAPGNGQGDAAAVPADKERTGNTSFIVAIAVAFLAVALIVGQRVFFPR